MSKIHVEEILRKRPELFGILGKKLIASLCDAKVKRIDATLLAQYPWNGDRYLFISTDGQQLAEVGKGSLKQHIRKFFNVCGERVAEAFERIDVERADYILAICHEEEEEGFVLVPKHIVVYLRPTNKNMSTVVTEFADETQHVIKTMNNDY